MEKSFKEALHDRRTYYAIGNSSPISDQEIEEIINFAILNVPSAFNSQSTRLVLLLGDNHRKVWNIAKEQLRRVVPPEAFAATETKIDCSFAAGYGTVLYYEDLSVVKDLQSRFTLYANNFPGWAEQTSAMHQIAVWTMLEQAGFGASLQHYNPLIDSEVAAEWKIPTTWKLIAQMPFGTPLAEPAPKTFEPLANRVKVFK